THNRLCARVFFDLARGGRLAGDWLRGQIDALARPEGDIDALMQRLAGIRVWSYITARTAWTRDALALQARARAVEDLLSDALHERLIARFVDRRAAVLMRRLDATDGKGVLSAVTRQGEVVVEGHPVGTIGGFIFYPDPTAVGEQRQLVLRAARRALHQEVPRRVAAAEHADDAAFAFGSGHTVEWNGAEVARLRAGESPLHPQAVVLDSEFLDGAQRERLRRRLQRWLEERVRTDLAPLFEAIERAETDRALRGPLHRLQECLGVIAGAAGRESTPEQRRSLKALGVRAGRFALFLPALLKPRPTLMRARLWAIREGIPLPALPAPGLVSVAAPPDWPEGFAEAMGWLQAGPLLVRLDVAERVAAELWWTTRSGPIPLPPALGSRFSVAATALPAVLHRLGFRIIPAAVLAPEMFGPPASPTLVPKHSRRKTRRPIRIPIREAGPFAALATLVH
ncbi:MAG: helicase-related protein, partial [Acetobacteraceae bacterium]